jgi:outer membrane protein OmpA-like peptidoglycan-associated protein
LGSQLEKQTGDLQSLAGKIETSVDSWSQSLSAQLDRLDQRLAALEQAGPTPLDSLQAWTTRHSILFSDGNIPRSPDRAKAKLRELAALLLAGPAETHLRVIGYSDASGSDAKNREVSISRARNIAAQLQALKVPAARLHAVGRSTERPLNDSRGKNSENRRVEFELIFPGES